MFRIWPFLDCTVYFVVGFHSSKSATFNGKSSLLGLFIPAIALARLLHFAQNLPEFSHVEALVLSRE